MKSIVKEIFTNEGNFVLEGLDPYRPKNEDQQFVVDILFDEDGNARWEIVEAAENFAKEHNCLWDSDIAKYIICSKINSFTHCNYSDICLWR